MAQDLDSSPTGPDPAVLDAIEQNALSQLDAIRTGRQALEAYEWKVLAALGHLAVERAGRLSSDAIAMHMRAVAAEVGLQSRASDRTVEVRIGEAMALAPDASAAATCASSPTPARRWHRPRSRASSGQPTRPTCSPSPRPPRPPASPEPLMPTVLARGAEHRLRAGARAKPKDDPRTVDQWMADSACALLLAGTSEPTTDGAGLLGTISPVVQVTIPVTTITGASDAPGSIDGQSPVDADTARTLAGRASSWQRLLTDPVAGTVVEVDVYAPTAAQRRLLLARDEHCRFPGCAASARTSDVDHTIAWEDGGSTSLCNLAHLCRRHHTVKHATAWAVAQPEPGVLRWRSPLGTTYVDGPPPTGPTITPPTRRRDALPPPGREDAWWAANRATAAAEPPGDVPF